MQELQQALGVRASSTSVVVVGILGNSGKFDPLLVEDSEGDSARSPPLDPLRNYLTRGTCEKKVHIRWYIMGDSKKQDPLERDYYFEIKKRDPPKNLIYPSRLMQCILGAKPWENPRTSNKTIQWAKAKKHQGDVTV